MYSYLLVNIDSKHKPVIERAEYIYVHTGAVGFHAPSSSWSTDHFPEMVRVRVSFEPLGYSYVAFKNGQKNVSWLLQKLKPVLA